MKIFGILAFRLGRPSSSADLFDKWLLDSFYFKYLFFQSFGNNLRNLKYFELWYWKFPQTIIFLRDLFYNCKLSTRCHSVCGKLPWQLLAFVPVCWNTKKLVRYNNVKILLIWCIIKIRNLYTNILDGYVVYFRYKLVELELSLKCYTTGPPTCLYLPVGKILCDIFDELYFATKKSRPL